MDFCERPKHRPYTFLCFRLIKHFIICTAGFCVGLSSEMFPTTSDVLQDRHSLTDFEVEAIQVSQSLGMILGVIAAGIIFWHFAKYTVLIVSMNVLNVSASLFSIPWISQVHVLCLLHAGMGASGGFMVTAGNTGVTLLWREFDAASWLHCLHFFVAMGSMVSKHNAIPYINPKEEDIYIKHILQNGSTPGSVNDESISGPVVDFDLSNTSSMSFCNTSGLCVNNQTFNIEKSTRTVYSDDIVYHYSASGIFVFLFALTALSLFIYGQPKGFPAGQPTALCAHSTGLRSKSYTIYTIVMLVGFFLFLVSASAGLEGISYTFTDYDYPSNPNWEHISFFSYGMLIARFLSIFLTKVIPLKIYIIIDLIGIVIFSCIRCMATDDVDTDVLTAFTGAFLGLTLPNAMALASHELHMNSVFVLVLLDSTFSGILASTYLTEYFVNQYGDDSLIYVMCVYNLIMVLSFTAMMLCVRYLKPTSASFVVASSNGVMNGKHNPAYIINLEHHAEKNAEKDYMN